MRVQVIVMLLFLVCGCGGEVHNWVPQEEFADAVSAFVHAYCSSDVRIAAEGLEQYEERLKKWESDGVEDLDFNLMLSQVHARQYVVYRHMGEENIAQRCFARMVERRRRMTGGSRSITTNDVPVYVAWLDQSLTVEWKTAVEERKAPTNAE